MSVLFIVIVIAQMEKKKVIAAGLRVSSLILQSKSI